MSLATLDCTCGTCVPEASLNVCFHLFVTVSFKSLSYYAALVPKSNRECLLFLAVVTFATNDNFVLPKPTSEQWWSWRMRPEIPARNITCDKKEKTTVWKMTSIAKKLNSDIDIPHSGVFGDGDSVRWDRDRGFHLRPNNRLVAVPMSLWRSVCHRTRRFEGWRRYCCMSQLFANGSSYFRARGSRGVWLDRTRDNTRHGVAGRFTMSIGIIERCFRRWGNLHGPHFAWRKKKGTRKENDKTK